MLLVCVNFEIMYKFGPQPVYLYIKIPFFAGRTSHMSKDVQLSQFEELIWLICMNMSPSKLRITAFLYINTQATTLLFLVFRLISRFEFKGSNLRLNVKVKSARCGIYF